MGKVPSIDELEKNCTPVRTGDLNEIEELSAPFLGEKKGLLSMFRKEEKELPDTGHLPAASEALLVTGSYREAVKPLELLVKRSGSNHRIRDLALARAGQIAVLRGLPMDLSPLISELGMSRRDLQSALMWIRSSRSRREPIVEMEKLLFQSMYLFNRTEWIESERLSGSTLGTALSGLRRAVEIAEDTDRYHLSRCWLELSRFLLETGEQQEGMDLLDKLLNREGMDIKLSPFVEMEAGILKGDFEEDDEKAISSLKRARDLSVKFRNSVMLAEAGSIMGFRECRAGDIKGVDRVVHSAEIMSGSGRVTEGAAEKGEAGLWAIRLGDPQRGISLAKEAYKVLKASRDREILTRVLCILEYGYIVNDDRNKAKKLLLEIVSEYPVKQFPNTFAVLREAVRDVEWLRKDKDTAELFEEEIVYRISREAVEEIRSRAIDAYPNEFGAMLRGIEHITHIDPIMEGSSNRSSFMFSLFSRFTQRSVPGEGVVHSHPSGSAQPSRADVSLFGRFPGVNIIIAYPFEDDTMAAYDRLGNRVKLEIEQ